MVTLYDWWCCVSSGWAGWSWPNVRISHVTAIIWIPGTPPCLTHSVTDRTATAFLWIKTKEPQNSMASRNMFGLTERKYWVIIGWVSSFNKNIVIGPRASGECGVIQMRIIQESEREFKGGRFNNFGRDYQNIARSKSAKISLKH